MPVSFKIKALRPRPHLKRTLSMFCEKVIKRQRIEKEFLASDQEHANWDDDLNDAIDKAYYYAEKWSDF